MKNDVIVLLKGKNVDSKGIYSPTTNKLKLLCGSVIRKKVSQQFKYNAKRSSIINKICKENDETYILMEDFLFATPTAAAKFCLGYEVNGLLYWKTENNIKIKDIHLK